jgi:hypothetical protein
MTLTPADRAVLSAAARHLRAWTGRPQNAASGRTPAERVDPTVGRVADTLDRIAHARDAGELREVLRDAPHADDVAFLDFAAVRAGVADDEEAREAWLAATALLKRLRAWRGSAEGAAAADLANR